MNPVRAWNTFWFRPISARPLGAFRIVIGLLVMVHLGFLTVDLDYWLTDLGMLRGTEAREIAGPLRPSPLQWVQDPVTVRGFLAGSAVAATLFTIGWHTRVMGVLLYLTLLSIHQRAVPTNCGPDTLLLILVFYLMLSPCGASYSFDARRVARRRGTAAEPLIVPWAQRLIQLHVSLIYLNTAILKCNGSTWLGGTALHFILNNPEVGRFDFAFLTGYPVVINLLTLAGLMVEFALGFLLWNRAARPWVAVAGLALHAGVLLIVNVPLFGELMTACYLTFLTPAELDAVLSSFHPRQWFRSRTEGPTVVKGRVDPGGPLQGPHSPAAVAVVSEAQPQGPERS